MKIKDILKIERPSEKKLFKSEIGNRMLLWHGSRLTNYAAILNEGLRINDSYLDTTGFMFGKGVYFSDMSSKAANYCFTTK